MDEKGLIVLLTSSDVPFAETAADRAELTTSPRWPPAPFPGGVAILWDPAAGSSGRWDGRERRVRKRPQAPSATSWDSFAGKSSL